MRNIWASIRGSVGRRLTGAPGALESEHGFGGTRGWWGKACTGDSHTDLVGGLQYKTGVLCCQLACDALADMLAQLLLKHKTGLVLPVFRVQLYY